MAERERERLEWPLRRWKLDELGWNNTIDFQFKKVFFQAESFCPIIPFLSALSSSPPCHLNRLVNSMNISSRVLPPPPRVFFSIFNGFRFCLSYRIPPSFLSVSRWLYCLLKTGGRTPFRRENLQGWKKKKEKGVSR